MNSVASWRQSHFHWHFLFHSGLVQDWKLFLLLRGHQSSELNVCLILGGDVPLDDDDHPHPHHYHLHWNFLHPNNYHLVDGMTKKKKKKLKNDDMKMRKNNENSCEMSDDLLRNHIHVNLWEMLDSHLIFFDNIHNSF